MKLSNQRFAMRTQLDPEGGYSNATDMINCHRLHLLFLLMLAAATASAQRQRPLMVQTFGADGMPVPAAQFRLETADGMTTRGLTNEVGQWIIELAPSQLPTTVALEDPNYQAPEGKKRLESLPQRVDFILFAANPADMTREERITYTRFWPRFLSARADSTPHDENTTATAKFRPQAALAFLGGYRREEAGEPVRPEEGATSSTVSIRAIDPYGNPIRNVYVYLFQSQPGAASIRLWSSERTDAEGIARFRQVLPGRVYRAEAEGSGNSMGRSIFVRPGESRNYDLPSIALREPDRSLSGVIFDGDGPAEGTIVRVSPANRGLPKLSTATDEFGYFSLAPLPARAIEIEMIRSTPEGPRVAAIELVPGRDEVLIPFDVLSQPNR